MLKGLSPRVRGNLHLGGRPAAVDGSIPACAGEPLPDVGLGRRPEVYPRVCGGTRAFSCALYSGSGLSPRVRGNPKFA